MKQIKLIMWYILGYILFQLMHIVLLILVILECLSKTIEGIIFGLTDGHVDLGIVNKVEKFNYNMVGIIYIPYKKIANQILILCNQLQLSTSQSARKQLLAIIHYTIVMVGLILSLLGILSTLVYCIICIISIITFVIIINNKRFTT